MTVTPLGQGLYRVSDDEHTWVVAVAGPPENRWAWMDGRVWRLEAPAAQRTRTRRGGGSGDLTPPMPATVVRVMVEPGASVSRGQTLVMLEAMKMELPVRAPRDGVVRAVHCTAGELVQPGTELLELE